MKEQFSRMENMMGAEALERLQRSCVAVFGIGGVGGYATEALARSGVGRLILVDKDVVSISNLNRQLIATYSSIGRPKVEAMKARIQDINPDCQVETYECFYLPENKEVFDFTQYDYVIDAVDTVTAKIQLVLQAQEAGVPIISSMGTGNKLDPSRLQVADIYKTKVCPLAKVMRHELKKRNIKKLKVVYSEELPMESK
ncbi:MAG: tRNA threonylcarbamoyladenosine dehydratase, partial [Lachnospiraceae bacterium]|nr:tRNA threonylcarbamoyladenosine dehydratase [Lachnospiraceae bacterium]